LGDAGVDATYGVIGGLDLDQEDWFLEAWLGSKLTSEEVTSHGGSDLTATSVDSVGVEGNILNVEADTSHVLVGQDTLLGGPLEGSLARVHDFVEELALLGGINKQVGASGLGAEAPNLHCIIGVPLVFVLEDLLAELGVLLGVDLLVLNSEGEIVGEGASFSEDSVMLVGGLGEALLGRFISDGFLVGDNWVTLLQWALGVFLFEILKANLDVELTATSDNVLTGFLSGADDEGIGLGELTETFDKLGQVRGGFDLDGNTHDGGDGELHNTDVVGVFVVRDGSLLHEVLIDTDETDGVTAWYIGDGLDLTGHHEDSSLNVLDVQVSLGAGLVVGSHNSDLLASGDGTGEDTTESVETTTVVSGDHLGDEDHEGTVLVTLLEGLTACIIDGTLVKVSSSVLLGLDGGRKLHDDHLEESLSGVDPLLADDLHEILETTLLLLGGEGNVELFKHLPDLVELTVHASTDEVDKGLHDELDEAAGKFATIIIFGEALLGGGEVVVTPELDHKLLEVNLELIGVDTGEVGKGKGPTEKGGTESNGTNGGVNLLSLTHIVALVSGDNDVSGLDDTLEVLIHGLTIDLEFEDTTINLVDEEDGLDLLTESLTEDGLSLDANTFDVIDDDESTIGDTEGSSDLSGEIDVTGGVDQVDKVRLSITVTKLDVGLEVKGHTGGFDSNAALLLVSTSVGGAHISSLIASNNTGFGNKRVSEG